MITAGEVLKNKRESLGKSLSTVSADTKIQKRFLEYIEKDEYDKFDSEVFVSGFIKIYSKYLGLDVDKLLAVYRRSNLQNGIKTDTKTGKVKSKKNIKINITPQIIAVVILSIFLLSVIGYIGYQIYQYQKPPQLTILQPEDECKTDAGNILLKGNTESSATVLVNGETVETDSLGYFEKEIVLKDGVNTVTVVSKKNSNNQLETTKTIKVIRHTEQEKEEEVEENIPQEYKLTLQILQSASWIKLDVDGESKLSQIVEPNTTSEYTFEREFTLITGKINSTSIQINGEKVEITSRQNTGVGQITCKISQTGFECI